MRFIEDRSLENKTVDKLINSRKKLNLSLVIHAKQPE